MTGRVRPNWRIVRCSHTPVCFMPLAPAAPSLFGSAWRLCKTGDAQSSRWHSLSPRPSQREPSLEHPWNMRLDPLLGKRKRCPGTRVSPCFTFQKSLSYKTRQEYSILLSLSEQSLVDFQCKMDDNFHLHRTPLQQRDRNIFDDLQSLFRE